jgi:hypothetical protein
MNPEEPYRDQAERLRRRIEKINENTDSGDKMPPRGQLHRQKPKKTKWKLKYPVIRLLVLLFILLPITCVSIISYYHGKKINVAEKASVNNTGYETINLEKDNSNSNEKKENVVNNSTKNANQKAAKSSAIIEQPKMTEATVPKTNASKSIQSAKSTEKKSVQQSKTTSSKPVNQVEKEKIIYHVVQPKENLFRIALKYYHSKAGIDIIKKANRIWNDQITTGEVLKIPLNN